MRTFEYDDIIRYTNNFSQERFISEFQYGKVFRGRDGDQEFTVKVWNTDDMGRNGGGLLIEELYMFCKMNFKGCLKQIGYCDDEKDPAAVVYDLIAMDTVHNLIPKDNFLWSDRIKVALGVATGLWPIHSFDTQSPMRIRNIDAAHIMCDQEYTPILYDFGMIAGGLFSSRWKHDGRRGSCCYTDPYYCDTGDCSVKTDVYAYGVLLLGLISKQVFRNERDPALAIKRCQEVYKKKQTKRVRNPSLVDESLRSQRFFCHLDGCRVTKLAMQCINYKPEERPELFRVIERLRSLEIVRKHGDVFNMKQMQDKILN